MKVKAEIESLKTNKCIDIRHDLLARPLAEHETLLYERGREEEYNNVTQNTDPKTQKAVK